MERTDRTPLLADGTASNLGGGGGGRVYQSIEDDISIEQGNVTVKNTEFNIDISRRDFTWMLVGCWSA